MTFSKIIPDRNAEIKIYITGVMATAKKAYIQVGNIDQDIPRVKNCKYEPHVAKKYQKTITQCMEEIIIYMPAKGTTTDKIESHFREL